MSIRPPFVIGVAGKRFFFGDGDSTPERAVESLDVRETFLEILRWVRADPEACLFDPVDRKNIAPGTASAEQRQRAWPGLGLHEHPIIVLSSLAPGVDSIAAEAALDFDLALAQGTGARGEVPFLADGAGPETQAKGRGQIVVRCPLAMPAEEFRASPSFERRLGSEQQPDGREATRRAKFDELLARVQHQVSERAFPARRAFAVELGAEAQRQCAEQRADESLAQHQAKQRSIRYRAAGEYVAVYSQLLIAFDILDGAAQQLDYSATPLVKSGTWVAVAAKCRGASFGLLPGSDAFTWSDNGPALLVPLRSSEAEAHAAAQMLHPLDTNAVARPALRFRERLMMRLGLESVAAAKRRHALAGDATPVGSRTRDAASKAVADQTGMEYFRAMAEMLRRAPSSAAPRAASSGERSPEETELRSVFGLQEGQPGPESYAQELDQLLGQEVVGDLALHLARVRLGARAGGVPDPGSARPMPGVEKAEALRSRLMARLAGLVVIIALSLAAYEQWNPEVPGAGWGQGYFPDASGAWARVFLLLLGMSAIFLSARLYHRYLSTHAEQIRFDYRAVLGALRIQIFWIFLGLPKFVANEYMQRQHAELDWIRAFMLNVCAPASQWSEAWKHRDRSARIRAYECARRGWVEQQLAYFRSATSKNTVLAARFQIFGWACVVAGMVNLVGKLMGAALIPVRHLYQDHPGEIAWALAGLGLAAMLLHSLRPSRADTPRSTGTSLMRWILASPPVWGYGLILAAPVFLLPQMLPLGGAWPSSANSWWLISTSVPLVLGGVLFAWAERSFYSENARRYGAMEALYASANPRIIALIEELEAGDSPRAEKELRSIYSHLGVEALAENSEWLIQHRARPLEPFLAG